MSESLVRVDETTSPKRLDLIRYHADQKIYIMGVYEWSGDQLRWCIRGSEVFVKGKRRPNDSDPRPTRVGTRRGDGATLMILKRVENGKDPKDKGLRQGATSEVPESKSGKPRGS